jgi:RsiW-degrading membrane proteinase PrsW (M82 family)
VRLQQFFFLFFLFLIALASVPLALNYLYPEKEMLIPNFWVLFGFFSGLTLIIFLTGFMMGKISNKASGQALLGGITIRFLFCMVIALVYISNFKVEPVKFMINFFYLYFFNTVFEIYCLMRNLRNQNTK